MPAFYVLIILAAFALWIALTPIFKKFGRWAYRLLGDIKDQMREDDEDKIETEKETET